MSCIVARGVLAGGCSVEVDDGEAEEDIYQCRKRDDVQVEKRRCKCKTGHRTVQNAGQCQRELGTGDEVLRFSPGDECP